MANITYTITQDGEEISYTINDGVGPAGPNNITTATSTDITGILKGDGANVSAAVDGTDYLTPASVDARIADAINFFEDYFFTATPDALGGIYYEMKDTNGGVSADLVSGTLAAGNDQALFNFINNAGLGVSQLEGGYYELHVHASKTGTKATTIYAEIYTRTTGGTETLIGTTEVSGQLTGSDAIYDLTTRISDTPINTTDKLVVKWYANVGSAGSDVAVTIKVDGNTNSRIHVPVTTEILAQKYQAILAEGSFVDGDKTKLDGIEAGATADQTAAEILTAIKTVDGTGSGLDADLLDGQEASAFATSAQGALADSAVQPGDIDTLAELNAIITDATLIDTTDSRLSDARTPTAHTHTASDLDFAGSTDIGADLADADEVLVSDGGGNTTRRKSALLRVWTYIQSKLSGVYATLTGAETLTNKTLTSPTINSGTVSGTFSGTPTISGNTTVSGQKIILSNATAPSFTINAGSDTQVNRGGMALATGSGQHALGSLTNDMVLYAKSGGRFLYATSTAGVTQTVKATLDTAGNFDLNSGSLTFSSNSGTWDGATISGDQSFSGQVELTGQAASTDDSAMTRSLVDEWGLDNIGRIFNLTLADLTLASSGTGANAVTSANGIRLGSGTSTSGYARATLMSGTGGWVYSTPFQRPMAAALAITFSPASVTDTGSGIRIGFGISTTAPWDSDGLTGAGFGFEYEPDGTNHRIRAIAHDGTTFTAGSWVNIGTGGTYAGHRGLLIKSDGAGNISVTITAAYGDTSTTYTATTTGGPTTTASGVQSSIHAVACNESTGTPAFIGCDIKAARVRLD